MEVTLNYRFVGKSGANPSKNVFERKKIEQEPQETVSALYKTIYKPPFHSFGEFAPLFVFSIVFSLAPEINNFFVV